MPGAHCARSLARKKEAHEIVTTVAPESPGIPARNGFTAYFVISPVNRADLSPSPTKLLPLT